MFFSPGFIIFYDFDAWQRVKFSLSHGIADKIAHFSFLLRTPICIKHTPKWQKNINKYKKCM
jgi:hypothetical protein